jgi:hypothetical protein
MSDEHDDDGGNLPEDHQNESSSFEEFIVEEDVIDDLIDEALVVIKGSIKDLAQEASDHRFHLRKYSRGHGRSIINVLWMIIFLIILSIHLIYFAEGFGCLSHYYYASSMD